MKKFWHYFIKKITFKAIKFNVRKLIFSLITNSVYFGIIVSFLVKGICAWLLGANYSLNFSPLSVQPFWSCMRYIEVGTEYYLLFPIPVLSISDSCVTEHPPPLASMAIFHEGNRWQNSKIHSMTCTGGTSNILAHLNCRNI